MSLNLVKIGIKVSFERIISTLKQQGEQSVSVAKEMEKIKASLFPSGSVWDEHKFDS